MNDKYTKLTALIDQDFTVKEAKGYNYQFWDNANRTMKKEDKWFEGAQKKYTIITDKGELTLGPGQLANLLEAVYKNGKADINGVTFHVKSNGKSGLDIRYFFSVASKATLPRPSESRPTTEWVNKPVADNAFEDDPINLDDIPF
jgi:hypothetical protein